MQHTIVITSYSIHYTKLYDISKIKFALGNLYVSEEHVHSKKVIKNILNKILESLENCSKKFQDELKITDYPEPYLENPVSYAAFLENRITSYNVCYTKLLRRD